MCSDLKLVCVLVLFFAASCSQYRRIESIRSGEVGMTISVPDEQPVDEVEDEVIVDSIRSTLADEPFIMNAIRDMETGEMVATDVIKASTVTARFRNVAERFGYVSIGFDVRVPAGMADSRWQLKLSPKMTMMEEEIMLDPVFVTGKGYRDAQLRGYERYRRFIATIITDSTEYIRTGQLEIFLQRHFPETYAMREDSSYVSDPQAVTLFGATQAEALHHYTMKQKKRINEKRKQRRETMFNRYVRDPIVREGIRLDTVLSMSSGDFIYRYTHTFRSRPKLRKVVVNLEGSLYEDGREVLKVPRSGDLTFYISSLSTLADETPRYKMIILERRAYDYTRALLDFRQGCSDVDTTLGDNASELRRIRKCIAEVASRTEYALDSLIIVASCSPEGTWHANRKLSEQRAESVRRYFIDHVPEEWRDSLRTSEVPENWNQLCRLVRNDTELTAGERKRILKVVEENDDPDIAERRLAAMPRYRYLREKIYPKLRSVSFDFYLHRTGMVKDTVHTMELDSLYMEGLTALKDLDYRKAVTCLRAYADYNSALAFVSADYNHSALEVLENLDDTDPKVCYLKAVVLSRIGLREEALKYFELGIAYDPSIEHRANLDPEMSDVVKLRKLKSVSYEK